MGTVAERDSRLAGKERYRGNKACDGLVARDIPSSGERSGNPFRKSGFESQTSPQDFKLKGRK